MALKVELYGKNLDITDRINDYVTKKVSKLDRFFAPIDEVRVDLGFEKSARSAADRQSAQITIRGKGYILRTEERADDLFTAFDASLEKMQRQIERYKGKHERGRGDGTPASEVAPQPEVVEEAEPTPVIARRKHFHLAPMNEMEAIEQMILLGHEEFFVFYNADTNAINVLYRRRDNTYGLIEPEIG
ncbi:MAG: ribosome-associated translation inhibitor RaiA [Anaerolineaceae bacterium]